MGLLVYFTENLELKDSVTKNKSRKHSCSTRKTVIDNSYIVGVSEIDENNCKVILDKRAVGDDNILYVVGKIDEITDDIAPSVDEVDEVDEVDAEYYYSLADNDY